MRGGLFSVISMDPINAAELAAEYFLKRGKKRVCIFDLSTPLHRFRAAVFRDVFEQSGGIPEYRFIGPEESAPALLRDTECGYLFTGGQCFEYFAEHFPGDLAHERTVLTLDAKSEWLPGYLPVSTIGPDWRQIGVLAYEEAERRALTPGSMAKRRKRASRTVFLFDAVSSPRAPHPSRKKPSREDDRQKVRTRRSPVRQSPGGM